MYQWLELVANECNLPCYPVVKQQGSEELTWLEFIAIFHLEKPAGS